MDIFPERSVMILSPG